MGTGGHSKAGLRGDHPDDYSPILKTHDWRWGKALGHAQGKSISLNPLLVAGPTRGLRSSQPGPLFRVTPSCAILHRVQMGEGREGILGGRRGFECRVVRRVVLGTLGPLRVTGRSHTQWHSGVQLNSWLISALKTRGGMVEDRNTIFLDPPLLTQG